jgi:hypothetical protein
MIPAPARHQFASVLKAEHLADVPASFHDPAFFDEVPLYSRYTQVDFLKAYGEVDQLLLELSFEYLERVRPECAVGKRKRFIAVTIMRDDANEHIVPYIFICNSDADTRLNDLRLSPPSDGLGKYIQSLAEKTDHPEGYRVLEDRFTVSQDVRVYIGYKSPPEGLIGVDAFTHDRRWPATPRERSKRV